MKEAYDESYFKTLKYDILGFTHITAHDVLNHLDEKFLTLASRKKDEMFTETNIPWDLNHDLATSLVKLDDLEEELKRD